MAIYDSYARRGRVGLGVRVKLSQARSIFELARMHIVTKIGAVLEIGPGDGYIADLVRLQGLEYVAVEGSDAVAAKMEAVGYRVFRGYVPPLPSDLGQSGYQCCFLLHVLEHMRSPQDAANLVAEIYQLLTPGGALVIACPDYTRWGHYFYDCDYTHAYPVTRRRLLQLLTDHGFEVSCDTIYTGPLFGFLGLPLFWLAKLLYWPLLDDLIGPNRFKGILNRGFTTFLPNLLIVARRPVLT